MSLADDIPILNERCEFQADIELILANACNGRNKPLKCIYIGYGRRFCIGVHKKTSLFKKVIAPLLQRLAIIFSDAHVELSDDFFIKPT